MLDMGKDNPSYLPSSILSKKIKNFHDQATQLIPYLNDQNNVLKEVNAEETFSNAFRQLCSYVEPCVIHLRSGGANNEHRNRYLEWL